MTEGRVVESGEVANIIYRPEAEYTKKLLSYIPVLKRKKELSR
jgi:ABC-type dipeptide/oligopeptide/nickel transport system ATPase component